MWWRVGLGRVLLCAGLAGLRPSGCEGVSPPEQVHRYEASRLSMACVYSIVAYGSGAPTVPEVLERALDEVDRIDRLMSHYRPESPLSQLNREAALGPVPAPPELAAFLALCQRYSRESSGAFDVTVGPLMKTWGFFGGEGRLPEGSEIAAVLGNVGYAHVVVDSERSTVRFDRPGVEIDLGGIAKGYAVDRAVGILASAGITSALVSAGGSTLYAIGAPPGRPGWEVAIEDPLRPQQIARTVLLRDRALSVAGRHGKFFESGGVVYSHIMDPRTGWPTQGVASVAVLTGTGTAGDALDDAFFVLGVPASREYLKRLPPTEVFFFLVDGKSWRVTHLAN